MSHSRRNFLKTSLLAGTASLLAPHSRVLGANSDVRIAVIGLRWKGGEHAKDLLTTPGARLVALCDVDQAMLDRDTEKLGKLNAKFDTLRDIRKVLERKDIDAIVVATPNHWHTLATIWGCQAGKDVYVEKPCSYNLFEGRKAIEAARKYNRIVQHGTQQRSCPGQREAFDWINQGNLGKMLFVRTFIRNPRPTIGKVDGPQPIPPTVDYALWQGPAPEAPLMRKQFHYDWHWQWPYGNGEIGNNGVHFLDIARVVLKQESFPTRVCAFGGRFVVNDDAQTPNCITAFYDYKPVPLICEVRGLPQHPITDDMPKEKWKMDKYKALTGNGIHVQCENGYYLAGVGGGWVYDNKGEKVRKFVGDGGKGHMSNFIKAVNSRNVADLTADIQIGHVSAGLCHMANHSYRVGKTVKMDDVADAVKSETVLTESVESFRDHMGKLGLDVSKPLPVLGPSLTFDPAAERFTGDFADAANKLLTREYRPGFAVE